MNEVRVLKGRSRRKAPIVTNLHYYKVSLFYEVLDMQLQELNDRFTEVNTELLLCMECLSPENLFSAFDKEKLLQFAKFYPADFSSIEILALVRKGTRQCLFHQTEFKEEELVLASSSFVLQRGEEGLNDAFFRLNLKATVYKDRKSL
ncbi:hypothetical protein ZIOFF_065542 [Zingiber officinale]|uniref:Uncharacterized protein n=1 Tax=Zingiber officinale TaxID=94328 RepID=A0A8J5F2B5_ZINOF|nr:hypothetical protein ZIOFF_065542 [Zingiber officinale]